MKGGRAGQDRRYLEVLFNMILELQRVAVQLGMPQVHAACEKLLDDIDEMCEEEPDQHEADGFEEATRPDGEG